MNSIVNYGLWVILMCESSLIQGYLLFKHTHTHTHKLGKWLSEEALQIAEKEEKQKAKEKRKDVPI